MNKYSAKLTNAINKEIKWNVVWMGKDWDDCRYFPVSDMSKFPEIKTVTGVVSPNLFGGKEKTWVPMKALRRYFLETFQKDFPELYEAEAEIYAQRLIEKFPEKFGKSVKN
jgi:hypothetical protein